ncbi:MAG TPA: radical SAM protein [Armatimonadota bacterium]|jgi:biotin synthase
MQVAPRCNEILDAALAEQGPSRADCRYLLELPADSLEIEVTRSVTNVVARRRFHNEAILLGQIGIDVFPCPGKCAFCAFGEGHTSFAESYLSLEEILQRAHAFAGGDDLFALFLMAMHTFDFDRLLTVVEAVRSELPAHTQIVVNIGDFDAVQARELKAAGVNGAYHVLRLREGDDTALDPTQRRQTIHNLRDASLDFYYCCEPIGPEHTPEELVEQMFVGIDEGCFQHAAMRRVAVPGSPLASRGQITELRLAQITAVVALAALNSPTIKNLAVHEPNLIGLTSGANVVYAETGINPRDTAADTSGSRGLDMAACRRMLYEAGFSSLLRGDGSRVPLTLEHLQGGSQSDNGGTLCD